MFNFKKTLLFFLFLYTYSFSIGQSFFYQEINSSNGAPTDCIFDLAKDKNGLIYLGTDQGVYTFTGTKFELIPVKNAITNGYTGIMFTDEGELWCRNFANQVFYKENDTLIPFQKITPFLKEQNIVEMTIHKNHLYIALQHKIIIVNQKAKEIVAEIKANNLETIQALKDRVIAFSFNGDLFNIENFAIVETQKFSEDNYRIADAEKLFFINQSNPEKIIFTQENSSEKIRKSPTTFLEDNCYINNLHFINNDFVISTNKGTYFFLNNKWEKLLSSENHSDILEDFQGGLWISTIENGLIYIPSLQISLILNHPNEYFRHISPSPKGFFISTRKGKVFEITEDGKIIQEFNTKTGRDIEFTQYNKKQDRLYTSHGHFNYSNPEEFKPFYYGKNIAFDKYENFFFGLSNLGAVIPASKNFQYKKITLDNKDKANGIEFFNIRNKRTRDLLYHNNSIYIAYIDKLLKYTENEIIELTDEFGNPIYPTSITYDSQGNI